MKDVIKVTREYVIEYWSDKDRKAAIEALLKGMGSNGYSNSDGTGTSYIITPTQNFEVNKR